MIGPKTAVKADTIDAYEEFYSKNKCAVFASKDYCGQAREKIDALVWEEARKTTGIEGYLRYLTFGGQSHRKDATVRIEELARTPGCSG